MSFTKLSGFSKLIANLSDSPNENMSAMELKQYWDSSPEELRQALNRLIDELGTRNAARNIGIDTISGLAGSNIQDIVNNLKFLLDSHKNSQNNPHNVTAAQLNVYTKDELTPYLQGGDTVIVEEVFRIVNPNNGDNTFTYRDENNTLEVAICNDEGHQTFTLKNGTYNLGLNRIECIVNDTLRRSVKSGGLIEVANDLVTLTIPAVAGDEITFRYFQRIGITGEHNLVVSEVAPPRADGKTVWFKVVS